MVKELSPREIQIVKMVSQGYTNDEIGDKIGLAGKTVMHHLHNVYFKLEARNRPHCISIAYREGILP